MPTALRCRQILGGLGWRGLLPILGLRSYLLVCAARSPGCAFSFFENAVPKENKCLPQMEAARPGRGLACTLPHCSPQFPAPCHLGEHARGGRDLPLNQDPFLEMCPPTFSGSTYPMEARDEITWAHRGVCRDWPEVPGVRQVLRGRRHAPVTADHFEQLMGFPQGCVYVPR